MKNDAALSSLREMIQNWMNGNENTRNIATLARKCGASESSLRRIMSGVGLPRHDNLKRVLLSLFDAESFVEITDKIHPHMMDYLKTEVPFFQEYKGIDHSNQNIEVFFDTPLKKYIFLISMMPQGLSKKYFLSKFGTEANADLQFLISKEFIFMDKDEDTIRCKYKDYYFSEAFSKDLLVSITELSYKANTSNNLLNFTTASVTFEAYTEIYDILKEANDKIINICTNKIGNIPIFAASITETFLDKPKSEN